MAGPLTPPVAFSNASSPQSTVGLDTDFNYFAALVLDTIAQLRLTTPQTSGPPRVFVGGTTAIGTGQGFWYWYNPNDTTSPDNGSTIIVSADGSRWYQIGITQQAVFKSNTTSRASSAIVSDPDLQIFVPIAGTYRFEASVFIGTTATGATPGIALQMGFTGSFTAAVGNLWNSFGFMNGGVSSGAVGLNIAQGFQLFGNANGNSLTIVGSLQCSTTGFLAFQWGQNINAGGNPVTVNAGSYLTLTPV